MVLITEQSGVRFLKLYISRVFSSETEEAEYYIEDLKNLDVIDGNGVKIGKING
jgi:ribosomal 30S subunit maturation factor RimM